MAVLQSKIDQLRYIRRQNLEEEAKIVGNYYHDIIQQYGVDCNYYKLKIPYLDIFKSTLDNNQLIMHAYGEDLNPDYSISSDMITYMQIDSDLLQLNQYGVIPNSDVNFFFDSKDFACKLAYKLGKLKEYKIEKQEFIIEVPEIISDFVEYDSNKNGIIEDDEKFYLSDDNFPFEVGYGLPQFYHCDILSGKFCVKIGPYKIDEKTGCSQEYKVLCRPYQHGDLNIHFPINDTIYKSFNYNIGTKEYVDQILLLTYKIHKIKFADCYKYILRGYLHGAVLFHDLTQVGKYMDMIHPEVGDIVTIDFPDKDNRQQFQITECNDKNLGNDGINPLLHKYVWQCKARRYVNSGEDFPEHNEANERLDEKIEFFDDTLEKISQDKQISNYDESASDAVYGGYEREESVYDKNKIDKTEVTGLEFIDNGSYIDIFVFNDTSKLITDGYDLFYVDTKNMYYRLTTTEEKYQIQGNNLVTGDLQYLKASNDALFFVNFEGKIQKIAEDEEITQGEIQLCLNSLIDATHDMKDNNENGQFYYKFRECNTVLMSLNDHLYCRFGNKNGKMIKLNVTFPS